MTSKNLMKKHFILLLALLSAGATYQARTVHQNWKFSTPEILEQLDPLSGKWEVVTPSNLNQPLLSQAVKYADFPKVLLRDRDYYDFEVAAKIYISSENEETQAGGLILRYRNLYSFYMLFLNAKDKRLTLTRASLGGLKPIKRVNQNFAPDRWYELKARCYLNKIQAFVDGEPILQAEDETTTGGKIGLVTAGTSRVYFDSLSIQSETVEVTP